MPSSAPPRSLQFHLAEEALPDGVVVFLKERRAAGRSFDDIAYELRSDFNVRITYQSVRNWARRLGID